MPGSVQLEVVKPLPNAASGLTLFAMMRDEDYFLPYFFDYYRQIGVERFLIYDDRSGPATADFLMAQPDTGVLRSQLSYGDPLEGQVGVDGQPRRLQRFLKTQAPEMLLPDQWVVNVDADEFLVLPSGFSSLPDFIRRLDQICQPYATAPLIDFYGDTLADRNYDPGLDPFAGCPYFDAGPYYFWIGALHPLCFSGGVRQRLLEQLCASHPEEVRAIYGARSPPAIAVWKAPILRHGAGVSKDQRPYAQRPAAHRRDGCGARPFQVFAGVGRQDGGRPEGAAVP